MIITSLLPDVLFAIQFLDGTVLDVIMISVNLIFNRTKVRAVVVLIEW
jgi:hypothetical protein